MTLDISSDRLADAALVANMQRLVDDSLPLRRRLRRQVFDSMSPLHRFWGWYHWRGDIASLPVRVVEGSVKPRHAGESWGYTTRTGIPISHPSAYSRVGWSSMIYQPSTRRVEVGAEYVERMLAEGDDAAA
jgi:hypothetical protein